VYVEHLRAVPRAEVSIADIDADARVTIRLERRQRRCPDDQMTAASRAIPT
jgi:hypothetical protein